jgi:peptide-methionine (S)-S-oxide reductase
MDTHLRARGARAGKPRDRIMCGVLTFLLAAVALAAAPQQVHDTARRGPSSTGEQTAVLAGGCFWGVEAVFEGLTGVSDVVSGFAGGERQTAHYDMVSGGTTGHAEAVRITYDPARITYAQLLKVFFLVAHDPTELNRQGPDEGPQYRSAIFYANADQKREAEAAMAGLKTAHTFRRPIVTVVQPLDAFYPAEPYHQDFVRRNPDYPYVVYNDLPKLEHLKTAFPELLRKR